MFKNTAMLSTILGLVILLAFVAGMEWQENRQAKKIKELLSVQQGEAERSAQAFFDIGVDKPTDKPGK